MQKKEMPPVMILCGGKGTRLREVTELLPKPMVPIGEQPILWHIMKIYAAFGCRRFILCLGYKREAFVDFFTNYHLRMSDATITLGHDPTITFHESVPESDWEVTLVGTGLDTMTGGRVARAAKYLRPEDHTFFLTYGDGVADVDIAAVLAAHKRAKRLITVTAVHPPARFGEMILKGNRVAAFEEKPLRSTGYINGGYMVLDRAFVTKYLTAAKDPAAVSTCGRFVSCSTKPHRTSSRVASCLLNTPYHADTTATSRRRVTCLSPTTT